jgi:signal transduction histidine kinase
MTQAASRWQEEFTRALDEHLAGGEEAALLWAYDLGRKALAEGLGVLDVATRLHEALLDACLRAKTSEETVRRVEAARDFMLECLSPFEMAYRGVGEANTALRGLNELLEEQIRRISHELHDQAGQLLASVYLALDEVGRGLPPGVRGRLQGIRELLDKIEDQLRHLSHELRPTMLDDLGLGPALELLTKTTSIRSGLCVTVDVTPTERFPPRVEVAFYRIVQEALNNVVKHARATHVAVRLEREGRKICCFIRDDGIGFDVGGVLARGGAQGIGLIGIRERLAPLGGALQIISSPGKGTTLLITVPRDSSSTGP